MATGAALVRRAETQFGDHYKFGGEVKLDDPNPDHYDCSEYVQWACAMEHVAPAVPDGAFNQWKHCKAIDPVEALKIPGALMFVGDGTGSGRDAITHVVFSRGDGTTAEARGTAYGVGSWPAKGRFRWAGLIPGVDYSSSNVMKDDDMATATLYRLEADAAGDKKGDVFVVGLGGRDHLLPGDEYDEQVRQWGEPVGVNPVAWGWIVDNTALNEVGERSLPPVQYKQLLADIAALVKR